MRCCKLTSPQATSGFISPQRRPRSLTQTLSAGCLYLLLVSLGAFGLSGLVHAAPPLNDQCFSSETIPGAGPFPYLTAVTDVGDATTAGDPPVPDAIYQSGAEPSRSIWYAFTPAATGFYTLSTCRDAPTDTTLIDNFMALYTSVAGCAGPFVQLADSATTRGYADEACGPGFHQAAVTTTLQAGVTYYIVIWQFDATVPPPGNTWVQLRVNKVEPPANNACESAVGLALNVPLSGPTASSVGAQNFYQLASNSTAFKGIGQIISTAAGPEVVYTFTAPEAAGYNFTVRDFSEGSNLVIYVAASCPGSGTPPLIVTDVLAASHRNNYSSVEEIYNLALTNGQQVYVFVDEAAQSLGSSFTIEVNKCFLETEPNNTPDTASILFGGLTGSISNTVSSDVDFFSLGAWPVGSRVFAMVDASAAKSTDFDLRITTTNRSLQYNNESNDILYGDKAPNIAGTPLPSGPAFIRVNYAGGSVEPYTLYSVVQPPIDSATPETEPNNTLAQASSSPINYFTGSLAGPAPSTDVDVFVVNAAEGDLIFASLDGDPLRDNTPIDAQIELLDSQGNVLVIIDNLPPSNQPLSSTSPAATLSSTTPYSPSEALIYRVTSEGAYYVRVRISPDAPLAAAAGDYLLSISKNCFPGDRNSSLPPIIQAVTTGPANENQSASLSVLFTDPDRSEAHTVVIDWGDGQIENSANLPPGVTNYSATHFYQDNSSNPSGNYDVMVTVLDQYQTSASLGAPLKVLNIPPADLGLALDATVINEGGSVTLSGAFTDSGTLDTHSVSIAWGDGSPILITNLGLGDLTFTVSHAYLNNQGGKFLVNATVRDKDGGSVSSSTNLIVNNVTPTAPTLGWNASTVNENDPATLNISFADPGLLDTHTVTIVWGDGAQNTVTNLPAGVQSLSVIHVYRDDSPTATAFDLYSARVTVADSDSTSPASDISIRVNNVDPTLSNVSISSPIVVGSTATLSGKISDVGPQDSLVLTVNWGDGSASSVLNYPAGTTSFNVTHIYSTAGTNRSVALSLADDDGGLATGGTTITVHPPAKPRFQSITQLANKHMQVLLQGGTPGVAYSIQISSTLQAGSWSTLATRTCDNNGNIVYEDVTDPLQPKRIYRAIWP
jgi:hypothetical protein